MDFSGIAGCSLSDLAVLLFAKTKANHGAKGNGEPLSTPSSRRRNTGRKLVPGVISTSCPDLMRVLASVLQRDDTAIACVHRTTSSSSSLCRPGTSFKAPVFGWTRGALQPVG